MMKQPTADQSTGAPPTQTRVALDRSTYLPFFLSQLANGISRGASRVYLKIFGIGVVDWRILSVLALQPGSTAQDVCDALGLDKASASRSLRDLFKDGRILSRPSSRSARSAIFSLTDEGHALHDRVLAVALAREQVLLQGVSAEEKDAVLALLRKLSLNLPSIETFDAELISGGEDPDTR